MSERIVFTVDGREISALPGTKILNACDDAGVWIPRLCAMKGLTPWGSCRLCTVKVNGRFTSACTTPVAPGLVIESETEELLAMRRDLIDMLFVEGNHFCMFCEKSGDCELQALAYRFGITAPRFPYQFPEREVDSSHPDVILDRNRCILCARCVRASREIDGKHELGYVGRGVHKRITPDGSGLLADTKIEADDAAVAACPVGCLMPKRVGFTTPVGEREYDLAPIGADVETTHGDEGR